MFLRIGLILGAVGWAFLLVDAWRIGQPLSLSMPHRRAVIGVNGALCLFVASALLFGSHLVGAQRDLVQTMFGSGEASDASHGRYNVLLLGGDSGADRWGLRPDSLTIASIDEENGRTVLVSLPRNMTKFPFAPGSVMEEQFPDGFDCGDPNVDAARPMVFATTLLLLGIVILLNLFAIGMRNRLRRKYATAAV